MRAELFGGPGDGEVIDLPYLPPPMELKYLPPGGIRVTLRSFAEADPMAEARPVTYRLQRGWRQMNRAEYRWG